jgi:hypothetical protein
MGKRIVFLILLAFTASAIASDGDVEVETPSQATSSLFQIEGKIAPPDPKPKEWYWSTKIFLDGGKRFAYLKVTWTCKLHQFS